MTNDLLECNLGFHSLAFALVHCKCITLLQYTSPASIKISASMGRGCQASDRCVSPHVYWAHSLSIDGETCLKAFQHKMQGYCRNVFCLADSVTAGCNPSQPLESIISHKDLPPPLLC